MPCLLSWPCSVLVVNDSHESRSVDEFESLFLSGEESAGVTFHVFYDPNRLIPRKVDLHDELQGEIDEKSQPANTAILLGDLLFSWHRPFLSIQLFAMSSPGDSRG